MIQTHRRHPAIAISDFKNKVQSLNESDFGDFMRKTNHYLLKLKSEVGGVSSRAESKIDRMQKYVQFCSNWDIDFTKREVLEEADRLLKLT